jgi:hypothetical protein
LADIKVWKNKFKRKKPMLWEGAGLPLKDFQNLQLTQSIMGFLCIGIYLIANLLLEKPTPSLTSLAVIYLPFTFPYFQWLTTSFLGAAQSKKFKCRSFNDFKNIKDTDLIIFHQLGVLTEGRPQLKDSWVDDKADLNEKEIAHLLRDLNESTKNPLLMSLSTYFSRSGASKIKLNETELIPHMGLKAFFTNAQKKKEVAILSEFSWQKVLKHEIQPKGLEQISKWNGKGDIKLYFSVGKKVVAAFRFQDKVRKDAKEALKELKKSGIQLSLMTSLSELAHGVPDIFFNDIAHNGFPVERRASRDFWKEQRKRPLEVVSGWSTAHDSEVKYVTYSKNLIDVDPQIPFVIEGPQLKALPWMIRSSNIFSNTKLCYLGLIPLLAISLIFLPSLQLQITGVFGFYLLLLMHSSRLNFDLKSPN